MASSWEDRQVVCRGLVIQIKGAGYDTDYRYEDFVRAIINKLLTSHETRRFSRSEGNRRIHDQLKGAAVIRKHVRSQVNDTADVRTAKSFLKSIGAITSDEKVTRRGKEIIRNGLSSFLKKNIIRTKLVSPQASRIQVYKKGNKQTSYGNYRLRMYLQILEAADCASKAKVECEIEDVCLAVVKFWSLRSTKQGKAQVTEDLVRSTINRHFKKKKSGKVVYQTEFATLLDEALEDSSSSSISDQQYRRKLRNTADLVCNYFRLLENCGYVTTKRAPIDGWCLARFKDGKTGSVPSTQILLTAKGKQALKKYTGVTPVWFYDVINACGGLGYPKLINQTIDALNRISNGKKVKLPPHLQKVFRKLKAKPSRIDWDADYDIPNLGPLAQARFGL